MPFYLKRGEIPSKRHIQFRSKSGDLYHEEHLSREGFSSIYSNAYHLRPPTRVAKVGELKPVKLIPADDGQHRHRHLETFKFPASGDWVFGRRRLAFNRDVILSYARPAKQADYFYRSAHGDEVIFVHQGKGVLHSVFGKLEFGEWDYLVIPRGIVFRLELQSEDTRLLIIESAGQISPPCRYRNEFGQLLEHAPFCERDIRVPEFVPPVDEAGEFRLVLRLMDAFQEYTLAQHPFDLVGWDGYYYPWIFNMRDFMPITGKVHQPPPVHQTFEGRGFVICSFCPRLFDYHEQAIPAPYNHSNVDSDEVLYYVAGDFMSRTGVSEGSITVHPYGIPHGPQPGKYEGSIGKKATDEYAVMLDTFEPLTMARDSLEVDDPAYPYSWLE